MRIPWLSIDADGMTRGRLLGKLLGIPEVQGIGMAICLWHHGVEMSRDGDFTGAVPSAELIAAACSWPVDDAPRLVKALQQVGLVATHPALRVRGLDRYRRTWVKNSNFHRISAKSRPQVPSTGEMTANDGAKDEDEDEEVKKKPAPPVQIWPRPPKPKRERKPSAAEEFLAWLRATRAVKIQLSDSPLPASRVNSVIGKALSTHGRLTCERAYIAFLGLPEPASMDPPYPWQSYIARLPTLVSKATHLQPESKSL